MASIEKRPDGRYRARWREYPSGSQKTRQFARKGDAQRFLDGFRGDLAHGREMLSITCWRGWRALDRRRLRRLKR